MHFIQIQNIVYTVCSYENCKHIYVTECTCKLYILIIYPLLVMGPDLGPNFQDGRLVGPISGPERPPGTSLTILESLEWVETRFWVHLGVPRPQNCHQGREIYFSPPFDDFRLVPKNTLTTGVLQNLSHVDIKGFKNVYAFQGSRI